MQKDGYRRKPLPPKDDGAIELNFIAVKICTIKGCYQPVPAEYEKKTCLDCQERYKGYAVTKRAKRKALKRAGVGPDGKEILEHDEDSHESDDPDEDGSGPEDFPHEFRMEIDHREIPIDPAIHTDEPRQTIPAHVAPELATVSSSLFRKSTSNPFDRRNRPCRIFWNRRRYQLRHRLLCLGLQST